MGTDSVVVKPGLPRVCDTLLHLDVCKRILAKKKKEKKKDFDVGYRSVSPFIISSCIEKQLCSLARRLPCLYKVHIGNVYTFLALVFDVASDDG